MNEVKHIKNDWYMGTLVLFFGLSPNFVVGEPKSPVIVVISLIQ